MAEEQILPQQVREYYNKGLFALEKKNYDYAIELFTHCLSLKRDFSEARHYLRLAEQKKLKEQPPGPAAAIFNKIKHLPALLRAVILDIKNDSAAAIDVYEGILRSDPNNVFVLTRLGEDLLKEADLASALKVFEAVRLIDATNIVALKSLGQLYAQMENYVSARQCYEALLKVSPRDPEAEKGLKNLDALGAIKEKFGQSE